jgi:hypothetical protein
LKCGYLGEQLLLGVYGMHLQEGNAWWWVGTEGAENLVDVRKNKRGGIYESLRLGFTFKPRGFGS